MKIMRKSFLIQNNLANKIMSEKNILSKIKSRFIVNMKCAFQDFNKLYLVLELMQGGNLRFHLNHFEHFFPEKMIQFLIVNITLCLGAVHNNNILHRDIKPENFLFDNDGYLHLTDFNSAVNIYDENEKNDILNNYEFNIYNTKQKRIKNINKELVGTLGYIAPEHILATESEISFASDFYSFGVILYELIFKEKPYAATTRAMLGGQMLNKKINFNSKYKYSIGLINFVKELLEINPIKRLGSVKGYNEIKMHGYVYDLNWENFFEKKYESPFADLIDYHKKQIDYKNKDDMELFEAANARTLNITEEEKQKLDLIEIDPGFLTVFEDFNYIYFDNMDFNELIKGVDESFIIKNNKNRELYLSNIYDKSSNKSSLKDNYKSYSDSKYSKNPNVDDNNFFVKPKIKKKIVYLPLILRESKIPIPKMHSRVILDAYKYNVLKYRNKLNILENKRRLSKSGNKEMFNYYPMNFDNKKRLIFNNFYNPMNNQPFLNPSLSMRNIGQISEQNPNFKRYNNFYHINDNENNYSKFSTISRSETYEQLFGNKDNINIKNHNEKIIQKSKRKKSKEKKKK